MARVFGEGFKRVMKFDPQLNQVVPTDKVVGTNGEKKIEIKALDGENIFEPTNPDKPGIS